MPEAESQAASAFAQSERGLTRIRWDWVICAATFEAGSRRERGSRNDDARGRAVGGGGARLMRERWESGVSYNPLSAQMAQDPYATYAKLRARDPVHRSRLMGAWLFSRYRDVDSLYS